jgi:aryl-alcohol dehydrogenase-like predicted oxidoreductase
LSGKYRKGDKAPEGARRSVFNFPPVDLDRAYPILDAMREISEVHQVSVARVALAWLLSRDFVTSVIVGAKTTAQLIDDLGAASLRLSDEEIKRLDGLSELPAEYPGWMVPRKRGAFNDRRGFMN